MEHILVIVKHPGQDPYVEPLFENSLKSFQEAVGGYIETVTFSKDCCVICNEEGRLIGLPHNCEILGVDFVGTVLIVGTKGENFCSLKASTIPMLLKTFK